MCVLDKEQGLYILDIFDLKYNPRLSILLLMQSGVYLCIDHFVRVKMDFSITKSLLLPPYLEINLCLHIPLYLVSSLSTLP